MGDDRYEQGRQRLRELAGERGESVMAGLEEVSPDLARYVIEFGPSRLRCKLFKQEAGGSAFGYAQARKDPPPR